jgi:hypothetical protein
MLREKIEKDIGYATIEPNRSVIVGARQRWTITYYVGKRGIKKGGSIRITIPHTLTSPQINEFYKEGFTTAKCSRKEISLLMHIESRIFCAYCPELSHSGTFGKSLFIKINNGNLIEGDFINIIYGNVDFYGNEPWGPKRPKAPEVSGKYEFTIAVDPDGTKLAPVTGYFLLKKSPIVTILPGKLKEIIPIAPSNIDLEQEIPVCIVAVDKYLNPVKGEDGELTVKYGSKEKIYHSHNGMITLNPIDPVNSDKKYAIYNINQSEKEGVSSKTNPIKFGNYIDKENLYWGDIHAHTKYSDGMRTPEEAISFARDIARLDFAAITDHDDIGPYISDKEWEDTKRVIAKFNEPNKFVTFLGYEYRSSLADMNVYYLGDEGILMCGKKEQWSEPLKLNKVISQKGGTIIPHMHFGADWSGYNSTLYRVMEIYSQHGSAEYLGCPREIPYLKHQLQKGSEGNVNTTFQEILSLGMKLGVTAGSDSHSGRPGLSNWSRVTRTYNGGLTAVFAKDKTRKSIWEALYNRHCYATTGPRIYLEFFINGYSMGSELLASKRKLNIYCIGTCIIFKIEVIKNNRIIYTMKSKSPECNFSIYDIPEKKEDFYYIRIIQQDTEMAWSSPIWVRNK